MFFANDFERDTCFIFTFLCSNVFISFLVHFLVLCIHNFSSLSFQNLFLIQDHFHLALVILNVPTCKYVACDPFWVRLNKCSSISHYLCICCIPIASSCDLPLANIFNLI